jgi:phosphatidate cytidylyltransferase
MTSASEPGSNGAKGSGAALGDLLPRIVSGIIMIGLALAAWWVGGDYFVLFWLIAGLAIVWEWQTLIDAPNARARCLCGGACLVVAVVLTRNLGVDLAVPVLAVGCALLAWLAGDGTRLWAAAGLIYAASLVVSVTILRLQLIGGEDVILWLFAVVWGTDIMAYVGGRLIGGPKLWPRVSPKKTWSGFLTGCFCGGMLGIAALSAFGKSGQISLNALLVLGVTTAVVSQAGDFFESAIKRRFNVKDSSHLIPGHGGVMDRLDGFLFAATFVALVGVIREGFAFAAIGVLRW